MTPEWMRATEVGLALYCAGAVFVFGCVLFHLGELSRRNR